MCRMILALGKVNTRKLLLGLRRMAADGNSRHELNKDTSWKHQDGWGMAWREDRRWAIHKSITSLEREKFLPVVPKTSLLLLHTRRRTTGNLLVEDTQPFHHQDSVFCHNGTIHGEIPVPSSFQCHGKTDSERLFYCLLATRNNPIFLQNALDTLPKNAGTNVILTNAGHTFLAVQPTHYPLYYEMHLWQDKESIIISSEQLPEWEGTWKTIKAGTVLTINHTTRHITPL